MNCRESTSLLDEQGFEILARPDSDGTRRAIEAHAASCDDCRAALVAVRALNMDPVPALGPVALPGADTGATADEVDAANDSAAVPRWRARLPIMAGTPWRRRAPPRRAAAAIGLLLLGGAVFAAIAVVSRMVGGSGGESGGGAAESLARATVPESDAGADATAGRAQPAAVPDALAAISEYLEAAELRTHEDFSVALLGTMPDGEYFALLRRPPVYPPAAAQRGLEGSVVVEFTITETGDVTDAFAVESTDPLFEQPSIDSVLKSKYRPRVVGGVPEAVSGVRNIIRFQLEPSAEPSRQENAGSDGAEPAAGDAAHGDAAGRGRVADRATVGDRAGTDGPDRLLEEEVRSPGSETPPLDGRAFSAALEPAMACLDRNDLRCAELELDVVLATANLTPAQEAYLHHIYGFIHHRRGRYELAIEAYRKAVGATDDDAFMRPQQLKTLAQIYYERDRYQEALDTMLEYVRVAASVRATDYVFMDRLRELGAQG